MEYRALNTEELTALQTAIQRVFEAMQSGDMPQVTAKDGLNAAEQALTRLQPRTMIARDDEKRWRVRLSIGGMELSLDREEAIVREHRNGHGVAEMVGLFFLSLLGWRFTLRDKTAGDPEIRIVNGALVKPSK